MHRAFSNKLQITTINNYTNDGVTKTAVVSHPWKARSGSAQTSVKLMFRD